MRIVFPIFFLSGLILMSGCRDKKRYHDENPDLQEVSTGNVLDDIRQFQRKMNESFRDPEVSPLSDVERSRFKGLSFYEPDTNFRVEARLERTPDALPFLMPTTTSRQSMERVYGIARFYIDSEEFELEVYQNLELLDEEGYDGYLFLPFTDNTNGESTYEGGRYIDLDIPDSDILIIDFNRAYNPYCVYNEKYSCPIVPEVNHLDTEIRAGIKDYSKREP